MLTKTPSYAMNGGRHKPVNLLRRKPNFIFWHLKTGTFAERANLLEHASFYLKFASIFINSETWSPVQFCNTCYLRILPRFWPWSELCTWYSVHTSPPAVSCSQHFDLTRCEWSVKKAIWISFSSARPASVVKYYRWKYWPGDLETFQGGTPYLDKNIHPLPFFLSENIRMGTL